MGGLGNQLFQIATAYAYAKRNGGRLQIVRTTSNGNRPLYWDTLLRNVQPYLTTEVPSTLVPWHEWMPTMYSEIPVLTTAGIALGRVSAIGKVLRRVQGRDSCTVFGSRADIHRLPEVCPFVEGKRSRGHRSFATDRLCGGQGVSWTLDA